MNSNAARKVPAPTYDLTQADYGELLRAVYGDIELMYAPADGGADSHRIAVNAGQQLHIASISPEAFEWVAPIVRAGLSKRVVLGVDVPNGGGPWFQFRALVDANDKVLSGEACNTLRASALQVLAQRALRATRLSTESPPAEIRIPQLRDLSSPPEKVSPEPAPER